jgi:hypothetical protein
VANGPAALVVAAVAGIDPGPGQPLLDDPGQVVRVLQSVDEGLELVHDVVGVERPVVRPDELLDPDGRLGDLEEHALAVPVLNAAGRCQGLRRRRAPPRVSRVLERGWLHACAASCKLTHPPPSTCMQTGPAPQLPAGPRPAPGPRGHRPLRGRLSAVIDQPLAPWGGEGRGGEGPHGPSGW